MAEMATYVLFMVHTDDDDDDDDNDDDDTLIFYSIDRDRWTQNRASRKPLRLLENTTDVVFPRREFVRLYRGTLSPLPKTGVFGVFLHPQVVHSVVFTTFFLLEFF